MIFFFFPSLSLFPDSPPASQVERIVDKRKNKKGKWEYLIRWKGYGSTEDTWEPEHHLLHCEEFIDEFNGLHLAKDKRLKSGKQPGASKLLRDGRGPSVEKLPHRPSDAGKSKGTSHKRKRVNPSLSKPKKGYSAKPPASGDRAAKTVSYRTTPSGLQIMPLKKAQNGMENGDAGSEKDERPFGDGSHQPDLDLNDVGEQDLGDCDGSPAVLAENGLGMWLLLLSDGTLRAAWGNTGPLPWLSYLGPCRLNPLPFPDAYVGGGGQATDTPAKASPRSSIPSCPRGHPRPW